MAFLLCSAGAFAQQQPSPDAAKDPYAAPPPAPKPPSATPDKGCSGQAVKGDKGPWKASSTCPSATSPDNTPPLTTAPADDRKNKKSTVDDNPFPQDISEKAAAEARARESATDKPAAADAGESSSREKLDGMDLEGDRDSRISNGAGGVVHDPKLAADDIHVGEFYLNREDYKGAYARFKEATLADPENPEAVFDLAEAARRMNQRNEAIQNYQLYLAALPKGPRAKAAQKALHDLNASAKR